MKRSVILIAFDVENCDLFLFWVKTSVMLVAFDVEIIIHVALSFS